MRKLTFTPLAWSFTLFSQESSAWIWIQDQYRILPMRFNMAYRLGCWYKCLYGLSMVYTCAKMQSIHIHEIYRIFVWSLYLFCLYFLGIPAEALVCFGRWGTGHFEGLHRRLGWFLFWQYDILSWQQDLGLLFVLGNFMQWQWQKAKLQWRLPNFPHCQLRWGVDTTIEVRFRSSMVLHGPMGKNRSRFMIVSWALDVAQAKILDHLLTRPWERVSCGTFCPIFGIKMQINDPLHRNA